MVGGDKEAFDACHQGVLKRWAPISCTKAAPGCGQHTKMANQICPFRRGGQCSVKAIAYGKKGRSGCGYHAGQHQRRCGGQLADDQHRPRMLKRIYALASSSSTTSRDMNIATEEAEDVGLEPPILNEVLRLYERMDAEGLGQP